MTILTMRAVSEKTLKPAFSATLVPKAAELLVTLAGL